MGLLRQRAEMLHPSCCSAISAKLCSYWKCSTKHSLHAFFCYHKFLGNLSTVLPCFFPWYSEETPQSITVGSIPFSMLYPLFFFQHHLILPLQQHTHYSFFRFISMSCHPDGPFLLISSPLPYATTLSSWISNPAPSSSHHRSLLASRAFLKRVWYYLPANWYCMGIHTYQIPCGACT